MNGAVTLVEVLTLVDIALGLLPIADCTAGDLDADGAIDVSEIIAVVNALNCGGPCPTPTPRPTHTATATATATAVPLGSWGNGILERNEQCDPPADAAAAASGRRAAAAARARCALPACPTAPTAPANREQGPAKAISNAGHRAARPRPSAAAAASWRQADIARRAARDEPGAVSSGR